MSGFKAPSLEIVIDPSDSAFSGSGGGSERMVRNARESLSQLSSVLAEAARDFQNILDDAGPDEVQLGLNVSLEAEGKWLIVSGKAKATASVTLSWKDKGN